VASSSCLVSRPVSSQLPRATAADGACASTASVGSHGGNSATRLRARRPSSSARNAASRLVRRLGRRRRGWGTYCLSELGPMSRPAVVSGCARCTAGWLRGCPGLSGSATWWSVTGWLIGQSGCSDSGRSVFVGSPPGRGSRDTCGSWPEAWKSSWSGGRGGADRGRGVSWSRSVPGPSRRRQPSRRRWASACPRRRRPPSPVNPSGRRRVRWTRLRRSAARDARRRSWFGAGGHAQRHRRTSWWS
jgi:hypothetical protein